MPFLSETLYLRDLHLHKSYYYVLLFSPPVFLVGIYLLQRKCDKSKNFTWTAGFCHVLSFILFAVCIGIGCSSGIKYVIYEDVLLEKAIAQYENPPEELIRYHHADGARNTFSPISGGLYTLIYMIKWSSVLLIFWLIDRFFSRRK